jgi:hypothetical protein
MQIDATSSRSVKPRPASYRLGTVSSVLAAVREPGVLLAGWERRIPVEIAALLDARRVGERDFFEGHADAAHPALFDEVLAELDPVARAWLADDVVGLVTRFAAVARSARVRIGLGAVHGDQCRKFHADMHRYRLITTYVGPGTEWVPEDAVDRAAMEHPPDCPCDANREIVRDAAAVRCAAAGDVLVMRGSLAPGGLGAVHRSPPIEAEGLARIVLVVTTVERE